MKLVNAARATRRRTRVEWQQLIDVWVGSDLSIKEFCIQEGIGIRTFCWWRSALATGRVTGQSRVASGGGVEKGHSGRPAGRDTEGVSFLEVSPTVLKARRGGSVGDGTALEVPAAAGLEVVLPRGRLVRVPPGFDRKTLVDVLAILEQVGASC